MTTVKRNINTITATYQGVDIGCVTALGNITFTADKIEVTCLSSTGYRQYINGAKDVADIPITVAYDPSNNTAQVALRTAYENDTDGSLNITFPDTSTTTIYGHITSVDVPVVFGDVYSCTFTFAPSNSTAPTFTEETA